jgi:Protein of unknown function (DUF2726)
MQWLILGISSLVLALGGAAWWWRKRPQRMPESWPLATRKVFSQAEQKAYFQMRSAFPELCVLVKLPLSRFLQLTETKNMQYWFGLLSPLFVTFAVCAPDGKVLAVVDFDSSKNPGSRSALTLKRRAFQACKLMYLRYDYEAMPSVRTLRASVLGPASLEALAAAPAAAAAVQAHEALTPQQTIRKLEEMAAATARETELARAQLEQIVKDKRHDRNSSRSKDTERWAPDSILGRDSFLQPDNAGDGGVDLVIH